MQLCFNSYFAEVKGVWVYGDAMADVFFVFDFILKYVCSLMLLTKRPLIYRCVVLTRV